MIKIYRELKYGIKHSEIPKEASALIETLKGLGAFQKLPDMYKLKKIYRIAKININMAGTGFAAVFGSENKRDRLIFPENLNTANSGDIVVIKKKRSLKGGTRVALVLKRSKNTTLVYLDKVKNNIIARGFKIPLPRTLLATKKSLRQLPLGAVLKIGANDGNILEVLGVLDDEKIDEIISLGIFEKSEFFSDEAQLEADAYGNEVDKSMYPMRKDLSKLDFVTIDPNDAKDFDDAVYFDDTTCRLYVAIADVSEYVRAHTKLDKEAKHRGFSIYFPHKSIPMLPRTLSENICSLKPDVDRLAFVFEIELDPNTLHVKSEKLYEAIIHSKKRFTYDEVDEILANPNLSLNINVSNNIITMLKNLAKFTTKLKQKRLKNSFEFRSSDTRMILDDEQKLLSTKLEKSTPSHALIEDCMLLANTAAAKRLGEIGLFRNHKKPKEGKIEELITQLKIIGLHVDYNPNMVEFIKDVQHQSVHFENQEEIDKQLILAQQKAVYEAANKGHFGLGFDAYTHFTSPIRRYSDLIVHRLLKCDINSDEKLKNYLLNDIDYTCRSVSDLERESDRVAMDYMDRKYARWAKRNMDKRYEALIIKDGATEQVAKLESEIFGARILVGKSKAKLFDKVLVEFEKIDIAQAQISAKVLKILKPQSQTKNVRQADDV